MDEVVGSLATTHLRVARPTDHLTEVVQFYRDGLSFEVLYEFHDHDGFDGVMLGHKGAAYHLEFTHKRGHTAGRAPTKDNLLVFYLPDEAVWQHAVQRTLPVGVFDFPIDPPFKRVCWCGVLAMYDAGPGLH